MAFHPEALPSNEQVTETLIDRLYYPHKRAIWIASTIFAAVVLTTLGMRQHRQNELDRQWERYFAIDPATSAPQERVDSLRRLAADYPNAAVTPDILWQLVLTHIAMEDHDAALEALRELGSRYPDFEAFKLPRNAAAGGTETWADWLESTIEKEKVWKAETTYQHHWPSEDRLVLLETSAGKMWIGLYEDEAPAEVAAFVGHVKAGDYNGTQVYEVRRATDGGGQLFQAGSTASKDWSKPMDHDRDEPDTLIEPGETRFSLRHLRRMVSTAEMTSGESGLRFKIVTAPNGFPRYDGQSAPFGAVLEREGSIATMDAIGTATTYQNHSETRDNPDVDAVRDHPYPYIYIRRASVWKDEKLEDGHAWLDDAARQRIGTDQPEPWEADLPKPWLPAPKLPPTPEKDDAAPRNEDGTGTEDPEKK